jgi:hypothetical protein
VIECKPGTAPLYRTPYRMATLKLAELKEHIKELLEKDLSILAHPCGELL